MIIVGQHRNSQLAQRHLRALERKHKGSRVVIESRRNANGRYNARGHSFWFEVTEIEKRMELVIHFDYGSAKDRGDLLRFQVHVLAPGNVRDDEAIEIVRDHFGEATKEWPTGWKEKVIFWGHVRNEEDEVEHSYDPEDERQEFLADIAIRGGAAKVSRRAKVKASRRARKGKAKR